MDTHSTLEAIAGVSVTLVGFAALFRAFHGTRHDPHDGPRLNIIIEVGLFTIFGSFLPVLLSRVVETPDSTWVVSCAVMGIYYLRHTISHFWILRTPSRISSIAIGFVYIIVCSVPIAFGLGAFKISPWDLESTYLLGMILMLFHVGYAFYFQFRSEQYEPDA